MYSLRLLCPEIPPLLPFRQYSPPYLSAAAAEASFAPTRLITAYYHQHIPTRACGALSDPSHRSNSDHIAV